MFGIGLGEWVRPTWKSASMDNFWLTETVRYGLPAFILLTGAISWVAFKLSHLRAGVSQIHRCRAAWLTTIAGLAIAGGTVHFWNAVFCLLMFFIGSGVWMLDSDRDSAAGPSVMQLARQRAK